MTNAARLLDNPVVLLSEEVDVRLASEWATADIPAESRLGVERLGDRTPRFLRMSRRPTISPCCS